MLRGFSVSCTKFRPETLKMQAANVFGGQFHGIEGAISRFSGWEIVRRFVGS